MADIVRIFIGSGEASLLERKVLIYSLRKHAKRTLDIRVFDGTHDALEREGLPSCPLQLPLEIKRRNVTEFSNYRFMIPRLCDYHGRALWIDSDTICLTDIGELFDACLGDAAVLAKPDAYGSKPEERWGLSVSLFDCSRWTFDVAQLFAEVAEGLYSYTDLHQLSRRFRAVHPVKVLALDPRWNVFERYDAETKLIHYTNLLTQPWKYRGHPFGDIWFRYFNEARCEGFITDEDIELSLVRMYVRQDLLEGNDWTPAALTLSYLRQAGRMVKNRLHRWAS